MIHSPQAFFLLEKDTLGFKDYHAFKAHFGSSVDVCSVTWELIKQKKCYACLLLPIHLLWGLLFLKTYNKMDVLASLVRTSCNNFQEWILTILQQIQQLKQSVVRAVNVKIPSLSRFLFKQRLTSGSRFVGNNASPMAIAIIVGAW